MDKQRVRIFLDAQKEPIIDEELPTDATIDTTTLEDGEHRMIIRAQDQQGRVGVQEVPFRVSNGPGIVISGLRANSTRRGTLHFGVDAFSSDDPFDPRRAEARSSIPIWVYVLCLFVMAWAVWYAAGMWQVPAEFRDTPTYSEYASPPATPTDIPSPSKSGDADAGPAL
jgi:hypothetical protein